MTTPRRLIALAGIFIVSAAVGIFLLKSRRPIPPVEWVYFSGGAFSVGSPYTKEEIERRAGAPGVVSTFLENEKPPRPVTLNPFYLTRTEITVAQYLACIDAGVCTPLPKINRCNSQHDDRLTHPVNCVTWPQADKYCRWIGGRLPTEAEWEFAARSGGRDVLYPWGDDAPTCARAVIDNGTSACGPANRTQPICSHPTGNTPEGLCDMAGNVWEWTEDWFHPSYDNMKPDGTTNQFTLFTEPLKVLRGGGIQSTGDFRATHRVFHPIDWEYRGIGIRCAK